MLKIPKNLKYIDVLFFKKSQSYLYANRLKIYLAVLMILLGLMFDKIPYVNTYVESLLVWPVIITLMVYLFNVSTRIPVLLYTFLFLLCSFLTIAGIEGSELIGNSIFFLILYSWARLFRKYNKSIAYKNFK